MVIEDREEIEGDLIGKFDESSKDVLRREIVGLLVEFWEKLEERGERILEMVGSFEAYWGEGSWFRGVAKVKGELAEWEGCAEPIEELEPVEDF